MKRMLRQMKSAYELAMEKLNASDPDTRKTLSRKQKEELAAIDKLYSAKAAEREIFLEKQLAEALGKGEHEEAEKIRKQIVAEKARFEEEKEGKKDRIREGKD